MKLPFFKKADIILAILILAIGIGSVFVFANPKQGGKTAIVSVDGKVFASYDLSKDASYEIENEYGKNTITVQGGSVYVSQADCHGQDCVKLGKISSPGQLIVCLPHHLSVSISGDSQEGPDIVIR